MADYWEEKGEYRHALEWCDKAIDGLREHLADAYNLGGILLEELGREEEAGVIPAGPGNEARIG